MVDVITRVCPHCDTETPDRVCPNDGTATLMRNPPAVDLTKVAVGKVIAHRYALDRELGRGGFGAVFGARHTGTGQQVAVKVLSSVGDPSAIKRFFREARVTAALKSRHTIRVFDFGQDDDGLTYLAMELLTGQTVHEWLQSRSKTGTALSESEAVEVGIAVCK